MKVAAGELSTEERQNLDKFTKSLFLKSAQIIVQSRLGEKIHTKCNPQHASTDLFNLAIKDLPEVQSETKKALSVCGEVMSCSQLPFCVEISLRTVEGDTMTLETWCLGVLADQKDSTLRVTYTIYNRMGTLLKSLVSITRITPAYKLSRRQGPDSYVICYRMYLGEPQLHSLGEGYNQVKVGQLSTPIGTLQVSVSYRTKMTISPQPSSKDNSIMLKSDHFRPDNGPKNVRSQIDDLTSSLSETIKVGAFADSRKTSLAPSDANLVFPDVPFSSLLTSRYPTQQSPSSPTGDILSSILNQNSPVNRTSNTSSTPPASSVERKEDSDNGNITTTRCTSSSINEDFILVDLKTPFAGSNANSDLGLFYKECQTAPPLHGCCEEPTVAEQVGDLASQLKVFESNLQEYDNMLSSLCDSENGNE
ncbi:unnamed protein product [Bemisia tabaci]|uniref:Autophagy-related protein 13 n=1 Tax=Bemisia tabaci TaxID=7038 RepID=A0A9P0CF85_BEMTA|nr:unnamed protein product [Bemisia tabaci]